MGKVYDNLYRKYNKSVLSKTEVAEEFGISSRTLDRRLNEGKMIKPLDNGDDRRLEWYLKDIANYLGDKDE